MKISENVTKIWMRIKTEPYSRESAAALEELKNTDFAGYCSLICWIFGINVMQCPDRDGPFVYLCNAWPYSERVVELPLQEAEQAAILEIQAVERLYLEQEYRIIIELPGSELGNECLTTVKKIG